MKDRVRMEPSKRKRQLLDAAVKLAEKKGWRKLTRVMVAEATGTSDGLVSRYFGSRAGLREAVLDEARSTQNQTILSQ